MDRMMLVALAGTLGAVGAVRNASGQTLTWLNAAGGSIGTPANWNPAQVPGPANTMLFNLAAAYPLTFSSGVTSTSGITFSRGTQTLTINASHTTGLVIIGNGIGLTDTVNLATGRLNARDVRLGAVFGSVGNLNVNDDDAILNCSQLSIADDTNQICTVNVTNSGTIEASSVVIGNENSAGEGRMTVTGRTQVLPVLQSALRTSGSVVVGRGGTGSLTVANGAAAAVGTTMTVGQNVSARPTLSEGTVTVGGAGLGFPASLSVGSTLRIGSGMLASSDTGNGTFIVNDDGFVTVTGSTTVGGSGLGSGVLRVNTGGSFESGGLSFGTSGDLEHLGGTITVVGGSYVHDEAALTVSGSGAPVLVLDGVTNNPTFSGANALSGAIVVGQGATGILTLRGATQITTAVGDVYLGSGEGSNGTLTIENGARLSARTNADSSGDVIIGFGGPGRLDVRSGAVIDSRVLFVGGQTVSSPGTLVVDGSGTVAEISQLSIGTEAAGVGIATVSNGAVVRTTGQVIVAPGSTLTIDSGTIEATTNFRVEGALSMTNGTIMAEEFTSANDLSVSGAIRARVKLDGYVITATGDLVLGDGLSLGYTGAPLHAGPHRVTLDDSLTAVLNDTTIAGGRLVATDEFFLNPGRTLSGFGTIEGDFINSGTIIATGSVGLIFEGLLNNNGNEIGGTKVTFASGGGFNGHGVINGRVQNNAGATMTFTAASTIGDGTTFGFTGGGALDVTGALTINDSNGINLGSQTTLRNAVLTCPSTINLGTGSVLRGAGTVFGTLVSSGLLSPGIDGGDPTSQITVNGNYTQADVANLVTLEIDLEGAGRTQSDFLFVPNGVATLDGTLNVRLLNGFQPANGFRRVVVLANSIVNGLDTVNLPPRFHLEVTATAATVVFCSADFNDDGFVDFFDYDDFVACFEGAVCPAGADADFNGDGFADFFDYDDFVLAFEQGC
jgi:T5SS/PEP-CTERM-associated repeat protein